MATTEQFTAFIQQQAAQQNAILQALQAQQQQMNQAMNGLQQVLERAQRPPPADDGLEDFAPNLRGKNLARIKTCRPTRYNGERNEFSNFQKSVAVWASEHYSRAREYLEWAARQRAAITPRDLELCDECGDAEEMILFSKQVHRELIEMLNSEGQHIHHNTRPGDGLELWRRLRGHFNPMGANRSVYDLRAILRPPEAPVKDMHKIPNFINIWERRIREYGAMVDQANILGDEMKRVLLVECTYGKLKEHLMANLPQYDSYPELRDEIISYVERHTDLATGPHPMDLDNYEFEYEYWPWPQEEQFDVNAFNFPKGKGKGKGFKGGKGSKGKGKDGKGGNKGKGKGGGKCWYCNQDGHYARECPVKEYHDGQWWTKGDGKGYGANAMDYVPPVTTTTMTPPMAMTTTPHNHFDGIPLGGFERAICGVSKHIKAVSDPKANPVKAVSDLKSCPAHGTTHGARAPEAPVLRNRYQALEQKDEEEENNDVPLMAISGAAPDGWVKQEITIDSGAATSVMPQWWHPAYPTTDKDPATFYTTASGERLEDAGAKNLNVVTGSGDRRTMKFRLANVNKALASVDRICDAGNEVVFNHTGGSFIRNLATGEKTPIVRKRGVYVLDVWVAPPPKAGNNLKELGPFNVGGAAGGAAASSSSQMGGASGSSGGNPVPDFIRRVA